MKTIVEKAVLIFLLTISAVSGLAQQNGIVTFGYDANGNRILRSLSFSKVNENGKNVECENQNLSNAEDFFEHMEISIYPNPTQDKVNLTVANNPMETPLFVTLVTTTGDVIEKKQMTFGNELFDLSNQASGIYFLELMVGLEKHTWKIIKN